MQKIQLHLPDATLMGDQSGESVDFLLLHAGGERRQVWHPVMQRLSRSGLGSVAYDQRGHGRSEKKGSETITTFAADTAKMLTTHKSTRIVVGASLGGFAAILALAEYEEQSSLSGLVLVDVIPAPDPERVKNFLSNSMGNLGASPLVENILSNADRLLKATAALSLPLHLVLAGQNDAIHDYEIQRLKSLCPQLTVSHIDHASHLVARDAPTLLADHLIEFEQRHEVRYLSRSTGSA
ncbi:MAG: lysophospholipase [Sneathiellales bacterium]|nr:lysophospholipase [Sneathiellales bacterium]